MDINKHQTLPASNFGLAESTRNVFYALIPHGTKKSDIFRPEFFKDIAAQLTEKDRIECDAEDGTYFLELRVIAVAKRIGNQAPNWANVVELRHIDLVRLEDKNLKLPDGFVAKWRGGAKWSVVRKGETEAQDTVVVERQDTKADAIREFEKMKSKLVAA